MRAVFNEGVATGGIYPFGFISRVCIGVRFAVDMCLVFAV